MLTFGPVNTKALEVVSQLCADGGDRESQQCAIEPLGTFLERFSGLSVGASK